MNIIQRYKSLPVKTQSLLGIGVIVALVVALPLFIYGIVNFTYDIRERASTGEPVCVVNPTDFTVTLVHVDSTNPLQLDYEIAMRNNDSQDCAQSNYTMEVMPPTGWTGDFYTDSFSLSPGNAYNDNHLYMTAPSGFNTWPQSFTVSYSTSTNVHSGSVTVTYSPSTTPAPSASPTPTGAPTPPPTACASVPMTLNITPSSHNGAPGVTKRYDVNVTNNDSAGCGTATVYLQASVPIYLPDGTIRTGWTSNFATQNFILPTNTTYSTHLDIKSPTSGYSFGEHEFIVIVYSATVPQNYNSDSLVYNLVPGGTATASPAPNPSGEPNYCGGTCGSNSNCQAGYFCNKGYCRNPLCGDKTDCKCGTTSSTATPRVTSRPTATSQVVYLTPRASGSPRVSPTSTSTGQAVATVPDEQTPTSSSLMENLRKYGLWGLLGLGIILILSSIGHIFKKKDDDMTPSHITLDGDQTDTQDKPQDQNTPTPPLS